MTLLSNIGVATCPSRFAAPLRTGAFCSKHIFHPLLLRGRCVWKTRPLLGSVAPTRLLHEQQHSQPLASYIPTGTSNTTPSKEQPLSTHPSGADLPQSCPGCGALSQEIAPDQAGFYSRSRRVVKQYLRKQKRQLRLGATEDSEDVENLDKEEDAIAAPAKEDAPAEEMLKMPFCDRCHDLLHNSRGTPIAHPSIEDIADSIAESPFHRNHIYHVVDAADFPMSLVPEIFSKVEVAKPRSQNRRSQYDFSSKPTFSFIITRSDLLGSTKEMVDSMTMYFQNVLRQALGRFGKDIRLGNVHLVSAKRGWRTKEIKDEIWERGGGNWLVGKVNVGKSNLFEVLFPKGSGDRAPVYAELQQKQNVSDGDDAMHMSDAADDLLEEDRLLPPPQPETAFPVLPIVSSLPGTTASPIRLPFGRRRGELIDLPGLSRGNLDTFVKDENRLDLIMSHRQNVEQHIIKAGQSLLLGGLIRITPHLDEEDRSTTMLAYPFVPLKAHVTSTAKATDLQVGNLRFRGIGSIAAEHAGAHMRSAGEFALSTDVTKGRTGPLLSSGLALAKLPFRVFATDVLIEGMGWVELVCQVRRRKLCSTGLVAFGEGNSHERGAGGGESSISVPEFAPFASQPPLQDEAEFMFPKIEVFSPNGKHVSQRQSLQAWKRWTDGRRQRDLPNLNRPGGSMRTTRRRGH